MKDVLHAVFLPQSSEAQSTPRILEDGALSRLTGWMPEVTPTEEFPTQAPEVQYPDDISEGGTLEDSTDYGRRFVFIGGVFVSLIVVLLAQLAAASAPDNLITYLLYGLAILAWGSLLYVEYIQTGGSLLKRGPQVIGSVAAKDTPSNEAQFDITLRIVLAFTGLLFGVMTYFLSSGNTFRVAGLVTWGACLLCVMLVSARRDVFTLADDAWDWLTNLRSHLPEFRLVPTIMLLLIIAVAAFFRFYRLQMTPPEMTSDHVEKLLDAYRIVADDLPLIFFANNGGREALHFYLIPLVNWVFGTGWTFLTLKLTTAIEAMLLIPLMIALGREMVDRETGYIAAGLVAVSWWHTMLGRLALRIVLTPLVFTPVLICLMRGIRTGSRKAWIWAGFWMGVGVYSYQAMRIAPLVAVAAFLVATVGHVYHALRTNSKVQQRITSAVVSKQVLNLAAAAIVSMAIFIPMTRVWAEFPDKLWNRVINRTTSNEAIIEGSPVGVFVANYYDALRMYNFRGDGAWISSVPGERMMDTITGGLLVLGAAAWLVRLRLRGDPADAFAVAAILIMLLPSALALAFPNENPSTTRASGTLPLVFVLAAWPLSLLRRKSAELLGRRQGNLFACVIIALLFVGAAARNYDTYFNKYHEQYRLTAPYPRLLAEAAFDKLTELEGNSTSIDGVWLVSYPFWQDHRAFGAELGDVEFDRVVVDSMVLEQALFEAPALFTDRPLIFILNLNDEYGIEVLQQEFPGGELERQATGYSDKDFYLYTVEE